MRTLCLTFLIALHACGCATTNRAKTLQIMAVAGGGGALYGSSQLDFKEQNAAMYGAIGAALAGAIGLYLFDEAKVSASLRAEKAELERKLSVLEARSKPELVSEGTSFMSSPLPSDLAKLVQPGSWRRYRLDQWVQDESNPNVWYRQKEMFEVIPPQIAN